MIELIEDENGGQSLLDVLRGWTVAIKRKAEPPPVKVYDEEFRQVLINFGIDPDSIVAVSIGPMTPGGPKVTSTFTFSYTKIEDA